MQPQPTQPKPLQVGQTIQGENCYLVVTATKHESNKFTEANFANLNKNNELSDYYTECATGDYTEGRIKILGTLCVNDKLFNELSNSLLSDWKIVDLKKFGGSQSDDKRLDHITEFWKMTESEEKIWFATYYLLCLQVTNTETEETFYIDSQGYSYARYVGLPLDVDYSQRVKVRPDYTETQPETAQEPMSTTPNTYAKYCPNVFVAKCEQQHEKGSIIEIETKYGKIHEVEVYNLVTQKNGFFYYSIVRADGFNIQERAKQKAERYESWAAAAHKKSTQYYEASNEGKDFLSLGEPIKIGHHSEKRHRALIDRNWNRMGKSVEMSKKSDFHSEKAEYWASKANDINLSMPESLEFYEFELEKAKAKHQDLKDNPEKRSHSFSLTYAKKAVNELEDKVKTAQKLWA